MLVPALRSFTNLDLQSIVATSLAAIALVSAGGAMLAAAHGLMSWQHALPFSSGAVMGMLSGRAVAGRLAGPRVQQSFAIFAMAVAAWLFVKALL